MNYLPFVSWGVSKCASAPQRSMFFVSWWCLEILAETPVVVSVSGGGGVYQGPDISSFSLEDKLILEFITIVMQTELL